MPRLILLIFTGIFCVCSPNSQTKAQAPQDIPKQAINNTTLQEYTLSANFKSFDTIVEFVFTDTRDSISNTQKKNYEGFIEKQDLLTAEILEKIFEVYKSSYTDFKKVSRLMGGISNQELEQFLPKPTIPENLKRFITPSTVYIQNRHDCEEGTISIEFECTWDIEHGIGVLIKNWKVVEAGGAQICYF